MTNVVRPRRSVRSASWILRLALAVEARRRLVEDQDARIGEDGARDRHALALAAREARRRARRRRCRSLSAKLLDELVAVGDPRRVLDLVHRRVRLAVADVLGDRAVEQEVVLQHDAEVRAVARPAAGRRGRWPSMRMRALDRTVEGHHQADQRALARAARADQRRRRSGRRRRTRRPSAPARPGCTRTTRRRTSTSPRSVVERRLATRPRRPRSASA